MVENVRTCLKTQEIIGAKKTRQASNKCQGSLRVTRTREELTTLKPTRLLTLRPQQPIIPSRVDHVGNYCSAACNAILRPLPRSTFPRGPRNGPIVSRDKVLRKPLWVATTTPYPVFCKKSSFLNETVQTYLTHGATLGCELRCKLLGDSLLWLALVCWGANLPAYVRRLKKG